MNKGISYQIRENLMWRGWTLNNSTTAHYAAKKLAQDTGGKVYPLATPQRGVKGYAVIHDNALPLGCHWSTTKRGRPAIALGMWKEIRNAVNHKFGDLVL